MNRKEVRIGMKVKLSSKYLETLMNMVGEVLDFSDDFERPEVKVKDMNGLINWLPMSILEEVK